MLKVGLCSGLPLGQFWHISLPAVANSNVGTFGGLTIAKEMVGACGGLTSAQVGIFG